jgi:uncharacterized membrane protein
MMLACVQLRDQGFMEVQLQCHILSWRVVPEYLKSHLCQLLVSNITQLCIGLLILILQLTYLGLIFRAISVYPSFKQVYINFDIIKQKSDPTSQFLYTLSIEVRSYLLLRSLDLARLSFFVIITNYMCSQTLCAY